MTFLALIIAGFSEVGGVYFMGRFNSAQNFKLKIATFSGMVATFGLSLWLLRFSMSEFSMSSAYAIWTGIGCAGAVLLGLFQGEKMSFKKLAYLGLIIFSVVGLKFQM